VCVGGGGHLLVLTNVLDRVCVGWGGVGGAKGGGGEPVGLYQR
jgi:hypothetical protein